MSEFRYRSYYGRIYDREPGDTSPKGGSHMSTTQVRKRLNEQQDTIDQLRKQVAALRSWVDIYKTGYEKASEFIRLHPADPDITREQAEAWLALLAWRDAAESQGSAQQGGEQDG